MEFVGSGEAAKQAHDRGLFTTVEIEKLSGASYRQLDYWVRTGALTPAVEATGSGSARLFSRAEVEVAVVLVVLRKALFTGRNTPLLLLVPIIRRSLQSGRAVEIAPGFLLDARRCLPAKVMKVLDARESA